MVQPACEPIVIGACRVCGWKALTQGSLCVDCREVREWSRVNRAFCRLVHRDRYDDASPETPPPGVAGAGLPGAELRLPAGLDPDAPAPAHSAVSAA
jgi:hypothetical protein